MVLFSTRLPHHLPGIVLSAILHLTTILLFIGNGLIILCLFRLIYSSILIVTLHDNSAPI